MCLRDQSEKEFPTLVMWGEKKKARRVESRVPGSEFKIGVGAQ